MPLQANEDDAKKAADTVNASIAAGASFVYEDQTWYREDIPDNALLCPMIDARRMEVYTAIYDRALHEVVPTDAVIVNENSFAEILDKQPVFFFGNGADKCRNTLKHPNAHFIEGIVPKASNMLPLAERALALNETEDVAYYEPFYLKQFVAGKSRNLLNG